MFSDLPGAASHTGGTTHRQQVSRNQMLLNAIKILPAHLLGRTAYLKLPKSELLSGRNRDSRRGYYSRKEGELRSPRSTSPP